MTAAASLFGTSTMATSKVVQVASAGTMRATKPACRSVRGGAESHGHARAAVPITRRVHMQSGCLYPSKRNRLNIISGACVAHDSTDTVGTVPQPIVTLDNSSDPYATVVTIEFGDYLGDLLDTANSLRNLGLNIVKAKYSTNGKKSNRFFITDAPTGEKIFHPERLEDIRMTIINTMIQFHPESLTELANGFSKRSAKRASNPFVKLGPRVLPVVPTDISLKTDENDIRTIVELTTTDRPGLLCDIVKTLRDISVEVVSAKAETIGQKAHDIFAVTYHGEPLSRPMETLIENALYYYLARAEVEKEESY